MTADTRVVIEALGEVTASYGLRWMVGDQVAVAKKIAALPKITSADITRIVEGYDLKVPRGFSTAVARLIARWV